MVVIMVGLPGTGKTTLSRSILENLPGAHFNKDDVRAALFLPEDIDYTRAQDDLCIEVILVAASYLLQKDPTRLIVLDGRPFSRRVDRERVVAWAKASNAKWLMIKCVCSDANAKERIESASSHAAKNRDFALYSSLKASFEPLTEPHLVVNTDRSLDECVCLCVEYIQSNPAPGC
jgi:predicted kinase